MIRKFFSFIFFLPVPWTGQTVKGLNTMYGLRSILQLGAVMTGISLSRRDDGHRSLRVFSGTFNAGVQFVGLCSVG